MALTARVTNTVHGMIAEKRSGTRHFHRHDPLGSTIGLVNDAGTTTDTYTYWPYGTLQASAGSTQQPWKFVGKYGYYTDSATHDYVRARKYRKDLGRWLTVDPLWPILPEYVYALNSPLVRMDPSGLESCSTNCCCCPVSGSVTYSKLKGTDLDAPNYPASDQLWWQVLRFHWYGHLVKFTIRLKYFRTTRGSGGCSEPKDSEEAYQNGQRVKTIDWKDSALKVDWDTCAIPPQGCEGTVTCTLTDKPGTHNVAKLRNGGLGFYNTEWTLHKAITFTGPPSCGCANSIVLTFDQRLKWDKINNSGPPDHWEPNS